MTTAYSGDILGFFSSGNLLTGATFRNLAKVQCTPIRTREGEPPGKWLPLITYFASG
ncbi:MAG: hypothetical protein OEY55_11955 [Acidimicrobiia bacterium]|nr:hypothetical protein [Acidimicrobiia bacterium]